MTFCLGIKVDDGLVAISDTRVTSGNEYISAQKYFIHETENNQSMFVMTSGLRSVRDKAMTYFNEVIEREGEKYNRLYKALNALASEVRRVNHEDRKYIEAGGLDFNLFAIVGGQMPDDPEPTLYLLYPEGNWVEVGRSSPYFIIGNSGYGKPVLHRVLKHDSTLRFAMKSAFLSFESTRISVNDVDYPIDVLILKNKEFKTHHRCYDREELLTCSQQWQQAISSALKELDFDWCDTYLDQINEGVL